MANRPGKNEQNLGNFPVILSNPWTFLAKLLWGMYQPIPVFLTFPNYIPTPGGYNTSKSPSQIGYWLGLAMAQNPNPFYEFASRFTSGLSEDPTQKISVEFFKNFDPNSGQNSNCAPFADDCGFLMDSF